MVLARAAVRGLLDPIDFDRDGEAPLRCGMKAIVVTDEGDCGDGRGRRNRRDDAGRAARAGTGDKQRRRSGCSRVGIHLGRADVALDLDLRNVFTKLDISSRKQLRRALNGRGSHSP